ncbi:ATP-binding protein [Sporosarcina jiandibaonis]|uniref:ATP-binding protein n=1 Tax=Sporosarcina jiandibaonis TaxID=2715535 RepID=UPI001557F564|nr:AAA family ATPase [Sporosarcina jiandibaonis]
MKIEKLLIYGFGKHENVSINFSSDLNIVYGLNEAGKTTIQQFILHVLFGFPQRNSGSLRYEPKSGGKYGGQIQLVDQLYGRCTIERIRGKSSGDVKVHFEDGTTGGEEELKVLLRHYNRASFESIFSFSLLQLQSFEKMDEDELSRTLLASGTTGVDSLIQLEKRMETEMGELFKKSGRVPKMNLKMKELRELEVSLKEEQEKVEEYAPSISRIHEIEEQLASLRNQDSNHRKQLEQLALHRQRLPLQLKMEALQQQLERLGRTSFPADGIRRLESTTGKLIEAKAAKHRIEQEIAELSTRLPKNNHDDQLSKIDGLLAKESEWHGWRSTKTSLSDEIRRLESLKQRLLDRLGIKSDDGYQIIIEADVSLRKEEEMHELLNELTRLNNQIDFAEKQYAMVENEAEQVHAQLESLPTPSVEELKQAEEWPKIQQQLAEAKAYISFNKHAEKESKSKLLPVGLLLIAIAFVGYGIIQQQWYSVILGAIIGGIGTFMYSKKGDSDDSKLAEMESFVSAHAHKELEMKQLSDRIEFHAREKNRIEEAIHALRLKAETIKSELDRLSSQRRQTEVRFDEFIGAYGFDGLPSPGIIPELFRMIREVQEIGREMKDAIQLQSSIKAKLDHRHEDIQHVLQSAVSADSLYEVLRNTFIQLKEKVETKKSLKIRIERIKPSLVETNELIDSLEANLQALLKEAGAETEEDFYRAYDLHQEAIRLKEQVAALESQITASGPGYFEERITENEIVTKMTYHETELSIIADEVHSLINEKAALVNKTEKLLTDETYGQLLQLFEIKKAELAELAKEWSARKAISEAINRTMMELKEKKLPEVLQHAEQLFKELTDGKYTALIITEKGTFEVLSGNGMRYPIIELSQATKEQAYISLRLALAASILETAPFPIIMDDPFVHFDEERLSRMMKLVESARAHQFIYFTCHKKMKDHWVDATIINVSEIGSEQGAVV